MQPLGGRMFPCQERARCAPLQHRDRAVKDGTRSQSCDHCVSQSQREPSQPLGALLLRSPVGETCHGVRPGRSISHFPFTHTDQECGVSVLIFCLTDNHRGSHDRRSFSPPQRTHPIKGTGQKEVKHPIESV